MEKIIHVKRKGQSKGRDNERDEVQKEKRKVSKKKQNLIYADKEGRFVI